MARIFKPQAARTAEKSPTSLLVERQAHDGRGIAHHHGKTVFVSGGLPGETVQVSHYQSKSKWGECRVRQVIEPSPARIIPACPHYESCGGCNLQHQRPADQLQFKQQSVLQLLQRTAHIEPESLAQPLVSAHWQYRSRARLAVNRDDRLSFRARNSDSFVGIEHCPVLSLPLQRALSALQSITDWADHAITHVELVEGENQVGVVIRHVRALTDTQRQFLSQLSQDHSITVWLQGERHGELTDLEGRPTSPRLEYLLPEWGLSLAFHPQDFTQINRAINRQMVSQAVGWLALQPEDEVIDLFCGIGNFSLALARNCRRVTAIEAVETMVLRGRENARRNQIGNCEFVAMDLESESFTRRWNSQDVRAVLLDPPRAGARQAVEQLCRLQPEKVLYVSCNPASLARDAAILAQQGYRLSRLGIMDMFPHTAHVEAMALFVL